MSQPSNSAVMGSPTSSAVGAAAASGDFVVNLCASATPMAIEKPGIPELARYTFFVSRRREEGRERFRLHMGYFSSREEAEPMLRLVRERYPAAWIGENPLRKSAPGPVPGAPASALAAPAAAAPAQRMPGPSVPARPAGATAAPPVAAERGTSSGPDMSDSQVLRVLESRNQALQEREPAAAAGRDIAMLSPQDTQTWRDIKSQIRRDAVVHFAVQLSWSVTPIELARVPSLAIFHAYTLYRIEGNREGRKWYALRLGFFSDAVSAKQVAHYVRSEFAQVAVVPVGINEREQAGQIGAIALPDTPPAARSTPQDADEITLTDDEPAAAAAPRPLPSGDHRPERPAVAPQTLETTLEILGADRLSIDPARDERVVTGIRGQAVDSSTSVFAKLLDRVGGKLRR